ncbi:MAG: 30S ribosomal protein S2 [Phycisphaerae bacterium]|nr:30S ribosomal protein S2 [Phycisphaerae bacterium]
MRPFIFGKRNLIHIVDIRETLKGLLRAKKFVTRVVSSGQDVLFVGTKRQAREAVRAQVERCGMHYVTERWLGGTLTNFRTIRSRLIKLEEFEKLVGSPNWESEYSKKMQSTIQRELKKIKRNLEGIRRMTRLPGALVVVDVKKEVNAVREAKMLGIPTVCLIDTDSDPDFASIPIPGNDDAIRAIELVIRHLADAVIEGVRGRPEPSAETEQRESEAPAGPRRRGRRMGGRGESDAPSFEAPAPEPVSGALVSGASSDAAPAADPAPQA